MVTKQSKRSTAIPTSGQQISSKSSAKPSVLTNRSALLQHCKRFVSGAAALKLRNAIASDIEHFKSIRTRSTRTVFTGEKIEQQSKQRRKIKKYTPNAPTGRRTKDDERYLVSSVASAYSRFTDQIVTQNRESAPAGPSLFEQFLYPILEELRIFDPREKLSNHLKRRGPLDTK